MAPFGATGLNRKLNKWDICLDKIGRTFTRDRVRGRVIYMSLTNQRHFIDVNKQI